MDPVRRPLFWEGSAKHDFKQFPRPVQKEMGVALFVAQLGGTPPSAKPWKGLGSGIYELIEDYRGDTYRRDLHRETRRWNSCASRLPEEVEIWSQDTQDRYSARRTQIEIALEAASRR